MTPTEESDLKRAIYDVLDDERLPLFSTEDRVAFANAVLARLKELQRRREG